MGLESQPRTPVYHLSYSLHTNQHIWTAWKPKSIWWIIKLPSRFEILPDWGKEMFQCFLFRKLSRGGLGIGEIIERRGMNLDLFIQSLSIGFEGGATITATLRWDREISIELSKTVVSKGPLLWVFLTVGIQLIITVLDFIIWKAGSSFKNHEARLQHRAASFWERVTVLDGRPWAPSPSPVSPAFQLTTTQIDWRTLNQMI